MSIGSDIAGALGAVRRFGILDPFRTGASTAGLTRWGQSVAALYSAAALRHPGRAAIVDHRGSLSFTDLDRRSTALARGFRSMGLTSGDNLGILARNHRDFVEVTVAAAKLGLIPVYLNTGFGQDQLGDVLRREEVAAVVADAEFIELVDSTLGGNDSIPVVTADGAVPGDRMTMYEVRHLAKASNVWMNRPLIARPVAPVLLTSGTTGTPKGARRSTASDPRVGFGLIREIPYRTGDVFVIPTPLFHSWGLAQLTMAASLSSTVVLSPRFSPSETVDLVAAHQATVLAVVPVMLQRMMADPSFDPARLSTLRIVASSGSALASAIVVEWHERVGVNLYNLYGSTEVGPATLATPADLAHSPSTAGRPIPGSTVQILDNNAIPVETGTVGRIFVGNGAQFTGYTGGGGKETVDDLMASGDVGYFDENGLLFVTGRSDDMIVSGGENVFPGEVEDLLTSHPEVAEAAVIGVDDPDFGQRLEAFVVLRPGVVADSDDGELFKNFVATKLARHKVPRQVSIIDELPRNATGKLLRDQLR